ncbi:hypothetical protein BDV95DRAFT_505772 [Massariosphaeria phaeospora]|uniref:HIT-type domain-containing protein n=1 Tax=Massariosphaeria phaeospora TaxID=100035 RepID=A0A7C8I287_9PLEO|nr:hypothetical protein BDV95DRAFT_505772 [Massariosphaeria phaeospora]
MAEILCGVCNSEPKKYKCPTCSVPYCSIACFKEHKITHPVSDSNPPTPAPPLELPQPPAPEPPPRYLRKKIDFSTLATSPRFRNLLEANPAALPLLQRIYAATIEPEPDDNPAWRSGNYRGGRGGRGGGYRGRGRGRGGRWGGGSQPSRWTQKKGDADAMRMLKGLREGRSGDTEQDIISEFVALVEDMFGNKEKAATQQEGEETEIS